MCDCTQHIIESADTDAYRHMPYPSLFPYSLRIADKYTRYMAKGEPDRAGEPNSNSMEAGVCSEKTADTPCSEGADSEETTGKGGDVHSAEGNTEAAIGSDVTGPFSALGLGGENQTPMPETTDSAKGTAVSEPGGGNYAGIVENVHDTGDERVVRVVAGTFANRQGMRVHTECGPFFHTFTY